MISPQTEGPTTGDKVHTEATGSGDPALPGKQQLATGSLPALAHCGRAWLSPGLPLAAPGQTEQRVMWWQWAEQLAERMVKAEKSTTMEKTGTQAAEVCRAQPQLGPCRPAQCEVCGLCQASAQGNHAAQAQMPGPLAARESDVHQGAPDPRGHRGQESAAEGLLAPAPRRQATMVLKPSGTLDHPNADP